ncbi:MAG: hypothetical protein ACTSWY_06040 [Promethearchaeota archaeon]
MPKQSFRKTRKISVDLPWRIWGLYKEIGEKNGQKIKDFIVGAFEAIEFLDKLMSELLDDEQVKSIPKMLLRNVEKIEMLYTGKARIDNIGNSNQMEFSVDNEFKEDREKKIITHDIVKKFEEKDDKSIRLAKLKRKYLNAQ